MGLRFLIGAGLAALGLPAIALAQDGAGDAERNWAAMARCASIDAAEQRHQCVDEVFQQSGLLNPARLAEAARQEFGREARPATRAPERRRVPEPGQAGVDNIEELVTTIASVRTAGYRRLVVTTAEGSVWQQTQAENFTTPPKVGDRFVIQQAAFNSYRCRFGNSNRYRCERAD